MLDAFVQRVRTAYDAAFPDTAKPGYRCSFHLSRCYCGAPSWQQPCPSCGYYPWYGTTGTSAAADSATREAFVLRANAFGGVAAWYFASFRSTVAYRPGSVFAEKIDALVEEAKAWSDVPSPGELWDAVRATDPGSR